MPGRVTFTTVRTAFRDKMPGVPTILHITEGGGMPDALHVRVALSPSITFADAGEIEACGGSKNC